MRTLSSGAGGTRAVDEIRMTGDLFFPLNSKNCFSYEVKDHASTRLQQVFNNNGDIPEFWEQAVTDARRIKKFGVVPVLLFHISREDDYILIPYQPDFYQHLQEFNFPAQLQKTQFKNQMTKAQESFLTILTNLKGFTSTDPQWLFKIYKGLDYDEWNDHDSKRTTKLDVQKLVGQALAKEVK